MKHFQLIKQVEDPLGSDSSTRSSASVGGADHGPIQEKSKREETMMNSGGVQQEQELQQEQQQENSSMLMNLDALMKAIRHEEWSTVESMLEECPELASQTVRMVCQGENCTGIPLHFVLCHCSKYSPVSIVDSLVTACPSSLSSSRDGRGARLALHIAILKGASFALVKYLCEADPSSLQKPDQDGNLALHYAATYYCPKSPVFTFLLRLYPEACRIANNKDRLPLHLVCAHCYYKEDTTTVTTTKKDGDDGTLLFLSAVRDVIEAHPLALESPDRSGRFPIHVACAMGVATHYQRELLELLITSSSQTLLAQDTDNYTPYVLARRFSHGIQKRRPRQPKYQCCANGNDDNHLEFLQGCTNQERRKKFRSWLRHILLRHY